LRTVVVMPAYNAAKTLETTLARIPPGVVDTIILVDDGIATGASMLAAVRAIRTAGPAKIVVAVPVAPPSAYRQLAGAADDVVCVEVPAAFLAVGEYYRDFRQTSDDEVRELLATGTTG